MPKVLTFAEVKSEFDRRNYLLLATEYLNAHVKLPYTCPVGHNHSVSWNSFKSKGAGCPYCKKLRVDPQHVTDSFASEGYELLSPYRNAKTRMKFKCPAGHEHQITWDVWQRGGRCDRCAGRSLTDAEREMVATKHRIRKHIQSVLSNEAEGYFPKSKSGLAYDLACKIREKFGNIPEGYHIDHIIPISYFDHTQDAEVLACWSIENLRLLPGTENIQRKNKLKASEVEEFGLHKVLSIASRKPEKWVKYLNGMPSCS